MVASPLRRPDCCLETDGAAAVIVAPAGEFPDAPRLRAVVRGGGSGSSTMDKADDMARVFSAYLAPSLACRVTGGTDNVDGGANIVT